MRTAFLMAQNLRAARSLTKDGGFMKRNLINVIAVAGLLAACDGQPIIDTEGDGFSVTTTNLQSVEEEFVPQSITEDSGASTSSVRTSSSSEDICEGVDIIECQPRLIRAYLLIGKSAVAITHKIVLSVARDLRNAPDNSSGVIQVTDQNITVEYKKRSLLDYDFLVLKNGVPAGRVSANPQLFNIQFDLNIVDADKADSRGGKIDVQVQFTDRKHWNSIVTVTGTECNPLKPDDPTNGRIAVTRTGEIWTAQAMFYNGIAADYSGTKSCATPATDATGLVFYNDVVADHQAAKAALYMMKRTETSTANIENFGLPGICSSYADLCQAIATALGVTTTDLNTHLGTLGNPWCVKRGSREVSFNNDCSALSSEVAATPFLPNGSWMSPYDFYRLDITIPEHL
jgi:hypothetical protein